MQGSTSFPSYTCVDNRGILQVSTDRSGQARKAWTDRAGLVAPQRPRRRAHPRHQAPQIPGRKSGCRGHPAQSRANEGARRRLGARKVPGPALPRFDHGHDRSLTTDVSRPAVRLVGPLLLEGQQVLLDHLEKRRLFRLPARVNRSRHCGRCACGCLHDEGLSASDGRLLLRLRAIRFSDPADRLRHR